ncbi:alpha-ribazole phosphatase [Niastella caeni]|uniref:Alpha-ribazole phosphatase n=1 Tax=Niastella caeni TaxID=2569763 RepID=A0A4S8I1A4_9BACT|nr:alpha-ribazole phosphatase [Niastella caeni]THU41471.1 alpha-ribazole phosphatase [Niastella caeni]
MAIYLVRHTTPLIEKGICYGQSQIDVTASFEEEAKQIQAALPEGIEQVYSSPLIRCHKLASYLFPQHAINLEPDLMELHCGEWEGLHWDAIPSEVIDPWMKDFVNVCIPGGESYVQMHGRVTQCFTRIIEGPKPVAIVTHGGVIRSILAHITKTPLVDSFGAFKIHYGCVMQLQVTPAGFHFEELHNITTEKEQHKPSNFKR